MHVLILICVIFVFGIHEMLSWLCDKKVNNYLSGMVLTSIVWLSISLFFFNTNITYATQIVKPNIKNNSQLILLGDKYVNLNKVVGLFCDKSQSVEVSIPKTHYSFGVYYMVENKFKIINDKDQLKGL